MELICGLKVITADSNGAFANRKVYRTHKFMDPVVGEAKVSPIRLLTYVAPTGSYVFLLMYPILSKPRAVASISQAMGNVQGTCGTIKNELFGIILLKF